MIEYSRIIHVQERQENIFNKHYTTVNKRHYYEKYDSNSEVLFNDQYYDIDWIQSDMYFLR